MISSSGQFSNPQHELWSLLEALCEDRLSQEGFEKLEGWILDDQTAMRIYRDYIELHGSLYWDTALAGQSVTPALQSTQAAPLKTAWFKPALLCMSVLLCVGMGIWLADGFRAEDPAPSVVNSDNSPSPSVTDKNRTADPKPTLPTTPIPQNPIPDIAHDPWPAVAQRAPKPQTVTPTEEPSPKVVESHPDPPTVLPRVGGADVIVAAINADIRRGWEEVDVEPSPIARESEWVRRVHLDLVGHIPSAETVQEFLKDKREHKRAILINELLDDPAYVRNFATVWTNLLVGRSTKDDVDRVALHRFMRESFARNRPWSEVVSDLVAAEGPAEENGASGFLLAHLNNQAVPATAITARLFLCTQVQCTQCHKHPHNDSLQSNFWELNSFFKQTAIERRRIQHPNGKSHLARVLVSKSQGGPTFYEDLHGVMQVAYPKFAGKTVNPDSKINRRKELAELMVAGESPQLAKAMVNRMWAHFFGYGFTRPVDDMGPHNAPSHPELLARLSQEFVQSGYNVKELVRWICLSDAYQRSSQYTPKNEIDNPSAGELALFSRMYVRSMTAEQLYDSLLVASKAHLASGSSWQEIQEQRQAWLQQFVTAYETEENDEETQFEGTIPQVLLLMNSELVEYAVRPKQGTYFSEVLSAPGSDVEKIRRLCMAALSRNPTSQELAAARKLLKSRRGDPRASMEGLQDIFWAFLNSNEFILVH